MMLDRLGETIVREVRYRVEWEEDWDTEESDDLKKARKRLKELTTLHPNRRFRLISYIETASLIDIASGDDQ